MNSCLCGSHLGSIETWVMKFSGTGRKSVSGTVRRFFTPSSLKIARAYRSVPFSYTGSIHLVGSVFSHNSLLAISSVSESYGTASIIARNSISCENDTSFSSNADN